MATFGRAARWPPTTSLFAEPIPRKRTDSKQAGLKPPQNQRPPLREANRAGAKKGPGPFRNAKPTRGGPVQDSGIGSVVDELSEGLRKVSVQDMGAEASAEKENTKAACVDEEPQSFSTSLLPLGVPDIDADEESSHLHATMYAKDIFEYLASLEVKWPVQPNFLRNQPTITSQMRHVLVTWMMRVHERFELLHETLFLAVSLVDRYLQAKPIARSKLQLVGIGALFVASKYEETMVPALSDLTYVAGGAYRPAEARDMEQSILTVLDWSLGRPTPLHFLRRIERAGKVDGTSLSMAKYALEICLLRHDMSPIRPSELAAAALCLAIRFVMNDSKRWDATLAHYSRYSEQELQPTIKKMANIMMDAPVTAGNVYEKYHNRRLDNVSAKAAAHSATLRRIAQKGTV